MFYFFPKMLIITTGNLLFFLFIGVLIFLFFILFLVPKIHLPFMVIQRITLLITYLVFIVSVFFAVMFNNSDSGYQFLFEWPSLYFIGIDALSVYFVVLTPAIFPICILITRSDIPQAAVFFLLLFFLDFFFILDFLLPYLFFFYIVFESKLLRIFLFFINCGWFIFNIASTNFFF
mgnify:CR=1 FL=1